ncbi:Crp/Fnr family transcriptional regulator [Ramlibacter sp. PS4R-6]|uniref:Crp/Fnr family transcriptional regulator n=1 Tax=Ramlibacter sp. PS4R-6 TaxID=3133438 RepID=UPI0030A73A06
MAPKRPEYARIRLAFAASAHFRDLPAATLDALAEAATLRHCETGGLLHEANTPLDTFWVVVEGSLLMCCLNTRGERIPVGILGPGSFYSAALLVEGGGVPVTECRAERDTVGAAIPVARLQQLVRELPALRELFPKLLLHRFQAALTFYADAVSASLRDRLARRLMSLVVVSGHMPAREEVELRASQSDLAALLGASRSKLNAELRSLEADGVLRLGYRRIYVRDAHKLADLAGGPVMLI